MCLTKKLTTCENHTLHLIQSFEELIKRLLWIINSDSIIIYLHCSCTEEHSFIETIKTTVYFHTLLLVRSVFALKSWLCTRGSAIFISLLRKETNILRVNKIFLPFLFLFNYFQHKSQLYTFNIFQLLFLNLMLLLPTN